MSQFNVQDQLIRRPTNLRGKSQDHTASDTLTKKETGTTHTNYGATGSITFTLPPGNRKDVRFTFFVAADYALVVDPPAASAFILDQAAQTDGKSITLTKIGSVLQIESDGHGDWRVTNTRGTYQIEA
jgi:hypothetical protein